jgi:hypothetical protein
MRVTDKVPLPTRIRPASQLHTLVGRDGHVAEFIGRKLAVASSRETEHWRHTSAFAPKKWRCSACRWIEIELFLLEDPDLPQKRYVVYTRGCSQVPEEKTFARVAFADDAYDVLRLMTQWRGRSGQEDKPVLPEVNLIALEDAADLDPDLAEALRAWLDAGAGD